MKKIHKISEIPRIHADREGKYYMLSINCTPYFLSEPCLMRLNVLMQKYAQERKIGGYILDVNETDFWYFKVLADDLEDFWGEVEKILMEERTFITRWPKKFEGNLKQLQDKYMEQEKPAKQKKLVRIVEINGGNQNENAS